MPEPRPTLQRVIVVRIAVVFSLLVVVGSVALIYVVDQQAHEQTDLMLAQVVRTEADGVLREYEQGLHVHDTSVHLPALQDMVAEKYALVFGPNCRVLAATHNVDVDTLPADLCEQGLSGGTHVFDTTALTEADDVRLRAVSYAVASPDEEQLVFISAIDHAIIDESVAQARRAIVGGGILLVLAVVALAFFIARGLTREVERLSKSAADLESKATALKVENPGELFDVSDRTPAEIAHLAHALSSLVEKLQRLLTVQSRFIAEAAHELRTPLTALQGELEVTLRRERSAEEYRETLQRALRDSRRLSNLAESLLDAARTQSERIMTEPVELAGIVKDAVQRHRGKLEAAGVELELRLEQPELYVIADEMSLSRVLDNLLSNISEHSSASKVRLWVDVDSSGSTDCVDLHIRDDGAGLPDDVQGSLFSPLSGGRDGGHGLGLYIAHKLMAKQSGRLECVDAESGVHWRLRLKRSQSKRA
ncbi:MAG: histidine kinase dimerization/phospho-acceptor domain-containing protein [Myxococcota bacterium]